MASRQKGKKLGGLTSIGPLKFSGESTSIPRSALSREVVATSGNTCRLIAAWPCLALAMVPIAAWLGVCGCGSRVGSCKVAWIIGLQGCNTSCVVWLTGDVLAYWEIVNSPGRCSVWLILLCSGASL